jgi:hypothetical protein
MESRSKEQEIAMALFGSKKADTAPAITLERAQAMIEAACQKAAELGVASSPIQSSHSPRRRQK